MKSHMAGKNIYGLQQLGTVEENLVPTCFPPPRLYSGLLLGPQNVTKVKPRHFESQVSKILFGDSPKLFLHGSPAVREHTQDL